MYYSEIYHYGIPMKSGRYPWGSGERPHQRLEKKLTRRFDKADKRIERNQNAANKLYAKANEQRNSMFGFRRNKAQKTFDKATKYQDKVSRDIYRQSKAYKKYEKKFEVLEEKMSPELKARGLDFYNRAIQESKTFQNIDRLKTL